MNVSLLATKFFIPPPRGKAVERAELCRRLSEGLELEDRFSRRLTLVSAPAGFGKTSLVCEWLAGLPFGKAWLSLDEKDGDPARFLACLVSALQTAATDLGAWVLDALQVPQPPSMDTLLTRLVNELAACRSKLILVLDDYHMLNSPSIDEMLAFLVDNLPAQVHMVIATREDPGLPLARYRARGQMKEFRARDLKFSIAEVGDFLSTVMEIALPEPDLAALEARTEGWAAGLQCAALALQGFGEKQERTAFIASFSGSHRFVLDYLVEEVLLQQSGEIQGFLLASSCLGRFCGELCDAILDLPQGAGRARLEALDRANLFLVPLDGERRWYRYHHLFAELLRQRMSATPLPSSLDSSLIHARASLWFEKNDFIVEAFRHAAASGDFVRAEALIDDRRMPNHIRGVMMEVIGWLVALPESVKNERPSLWVKSATLSLVAGISEGVEERLLAAEMALRGKEWGEAPLFGQISTARATLAVSSYRLDDAKIHARRALELLPDREVSFRLAALWALGIACHFEGNRAEARRILEQVLADSRSAGVVNIQILSTLALGELEEGDNRLFQAADTFCRALKLSGDHPQPNVCVAFEGLARIHYEWNDLEKSEFYGEQGLILARQYDSAIDRFVSSEVFLAKLEMGKGNPELAEDRLARAELNALKHGFTHQIPGIKAAKALFQLRSGRIPEAEGLPPPVRIRILLAKGEFNAAAGLLDSWAFEVGNREDDRLRALVLRALVQESSGDSESALEALKAALELAEPGNHLRLFVDEGRPMRVLIQELTQSRKFPENGSFRGYANRILAAFPAEVGQRGRGLLSDRELEVLHLLAEGLSNQDMAEKLFLSLHTVKVHVRNIFAKLEVSSRTLAVARARSLGIFR